MRDVIRDQMIFAIRRKDKYWQGGGWHHNLSLALILPKKQAQRVIRIDIGMSGCELVEIMPIENGRAE